MSNDPREALRRYLEQRREMGEKELVLDGMTVEEPMKLVGLAGGGALKRAERKRGDVYAEELERRGLGPITTEIAPAPAYYYAEELHQQYLARNPFGYRCHANTGVPFPADA